MIFCNDQLLQRVTSDFLQRLTSTTSNERILQRVTSEFLQRANSATSNEWILQRVTSDFTTSNEQRATSEKLRLSFKQLWKKVSKSEQEKTAKICTVFWFFNFRSLMISRMQLFQRLR